MNEKDLRQLLINAEHIDARHTSSTEDYQQMLEEQWIENYVDGLTLPEVITNLTKAGYDV